MLGNTVMIERVVTLDTNLPIAHPQMIIKGKEGKIYT